MVIPPRLGHSSAQAQNLTLEFKKDNQDQENQDQENQDQENQDQENQNQTLLMQKFHPPR